MFGGHGGGGGGEEAVALVVYCYTLSCTMYQWNPDESVPIDHPLRIRVPLLLRVVKPGHHSKVSLNHERPICVTLVTMFKS